MFDAGSTHKSAGIRSNVGASLCLASDGGGDVEADIFARLNRQDSQVFVIFFSSIIHLIIIALSIPGTKSDRPMVASSTVLCLVRVIIKKNNCSNASSHPCLRTQD